MRKGQSIEHRQPNARRVRAKLASVQSQRLCRTVAHVANHMTPKQKHHLACLRETVEFYGRRFDKHKERDMEQALEDVERFIQATRDLVRFMDREGVGK